MARIAAISAAIVLLGIGHALADVNEPANLLISVAGEPPAPLPQPFGVVQDAYILNDGPITYSETTASGSVSGTNPYGQDYSKSGFVDPAHLRVTGSIVTAPTTSSFGEGTVDAVATWFTLKQGDAGLPDGNQVTIVVDIAFNGQLTVNENSGQAHFTASLNFVSSPQSTTREYPIVVNASLNPQQVDTWGFQGTVPVQRNCDYLDSRWPCPGTLNFNAIVRSNPFVVTVGTPYRLALTLAMNTHRDASASFDPGIATRYISTGFGLYNGPGQDPTPLTGLYTVTPLPSQGVGIKIKPHVIDLKPKRKLIKVSILSTDNFDAEDMVDQSSLTFGATGDEQSMAYCGSEGPHGKKGAHRGRLTCYFEKSETGFTCGDTTATLMGVTVNGTPIFGQSPVKITPCR